jgi:hypothetical protein
VPLIQAVLKSQHNGYCWSLDLKGVVASYGSVVTCIYSIFFFSKMKYYHVFFLGCSDGVRVQRRSTAAGRPGGGGRRGMVRHGGGDWAVFGWGNNDGHGDRRDCCRWVRVLLDRHATPTRPLLFGRRWSWWTWTTMGGWRSCSAWSISVSLYEEADSLSKNLVVGLIHPI